MRACLTPPIGVVPPLAMARPRGFAMIELLFALFIFSVALSGLWSAQMVGKRASYDALQRTVATDLARDMLARVQANAHHVQAYRQNDLGAPENPLPAPVVDCTQAECTGSELAVFDLWQWETLLLQGSVAGEAGGELLSPRACIGGEGGNVEVVLSWRALSQAPSQALSQAETGLAQTCVGLEEGSEAGQGSRHQLVLKTRLEGWV